MTTEYLRDTPADIERAAEILRGGGLVGIPTETVYGLAANALNGAAVAGIFRAKGRPMDNPLIVHIAEIDDIQRFSLAREIPGAARELAKRFWPGPLTIILRKGDAVPDEVSAGLDTVAIRLPAHPAARRIIREAGTPLAAPSANLSGSPSPTTAAHVMNDLNGKIDAVLDGGACDVGVESTVITLATDIPTVLRPGGVTVEQLRGALGFGRIDFRKHGDQVTHRLIRALLLDSTHYGLLELQLFDVICNPIKLVDLRFTNNVHLIPSVCRFPSMNAFVKLF